MHKTKIEYKAQLKKRKDKKERKTKEATTETRLKILVFCA
jgi:hypothetical protein